MPSTDVHTHLAPLLSHAVEGVQEDGDGRLVVDGHRVGLPGLYDAQRLTRQLVVNGVDRAWVSAPPPFYRQGMEPAQTRFWVRALDDGLRARLAGESTLDRLTYLPFDQPEVALELAGDVDDSLGWTASAGGGSVALDDPALDPLWTELEARQKPLVLHPGESPDTRLGPHYLSNLLGNPVESGVAAAQLVLGGVLARHPDLTIVLVHCGGVVPAVVGRWSRGHLRRRPPAARQRLPVPHGAGRSVRVDRPPSGRATRPYRGQRRGAGREAVTPELLTPEQFRAHFPILRTKTYLASCSQGALSDALAGALATFQASLLEYGNPWAIWVDEVERAREAFAELIGASPGEIAIVSCAIGMVSWCCIAIVSFICICAVSRICICIVSRICMCDVSFISVRLALFAGRGGCVAARQWEIVNELHLRLCRKTARERDGRVAQVACVCAGEQKRVRVRERGGEVARGSVTVAAQIIDARAVACGNARRPHAPRSCTDNEKIDLAISHSSDPKRAADRPSTKFRGRVFSFRRASCR